MIGDVTSQPEPSGVLVLAATPIGQAGDAPARLVAELAEADLIAAEDTRRLGRLAGELGVEVKGRVTSYFEGNEAARTPGLVERMVAGEPVVLVTDAGMPSVSDPGFRLVAACVADSLPVTCLPGPSAVTTALALSGLPCDRFCFEGFAPRKPGERTRWLTALRDEPRTAVFFESPHRLGSLLADAVSVLGGSRQAAVCRELTKTYEEVKRGTLSELAAWAEDGVRGEITVVLSGAEPRSVSVADLVEEVSSRVAAGERLKSAAAEVAEAAGVSKKELYDAVLASRKS